MFVFYHTRHDALICLLTKTSFFLAAYYGDGVYFALKATYSARDLYSRPDNQGHKRIYLCNVLTGEYTTGTQGMRIPPQKTGQQAHILYDSLVNNANAKKMEMFIIFNDTQAYPAYLITFTKVKWWNCYQKVW